MYYPNTLYFRIFQCLLCSCSFIHCKKSGHAGKPFNLDKVFLLNSLKRISNGSSLTLKSRNYSFKYTCVAETALIGTMENINLQLKIEGLTHQFNISESNLHNLNSHNNVDKASTLKLELSKTPAINNLPEAFVHIY